MGGCQINNPCFKEIKPNENYPIIVNNTINNSEMNKDEPKVSNEEINIALPVSPLNKISNKNSSKKKFPNKKENNKNDIVENNDNNILKDVNKNNLDNCN